MIECDRLAELDVPQSELQRIADVMPLPSFTDGYNNVETTYYLAEISIRRLLNRVHNTIYTQSRTLDDESNHPFTSDQLSRLEKICHELHRQLETWRSSIPEPFQVDIEGGQSPRHDRERVLMIRSFATHHIIYRPFVLHAIALGQLQAQGQNQDTAYTKLSDMVLEHCRMCLDSCRRYIYNACRMLGRSSPYTWTFSIS